MSDPVLYGLARSVYTRIARLVLEEKGVRYTLEEVEIFGSAGVPAEHLARQPFGRIPAFAHEGFTLYETDAITRYIDEAFPGTRLQPQELRARARMNQVIAIIDSYAYRPMIWAHRRAGRGHRVERDARRRIADAVAHLLSCPRGNSGDELLLRGR